MDCRRCNGISFNKIDSICEVYLAGDEVKTALTAPGYELYVPSGCPESDSGVYAMLYEDVLITSLLCAVSNETGERGLFLKLPGGAAYNYARGSDLVSWTPYKFVNEWTAYGVDKKGRVLRIRKTDHTFRNTYIYPTNATDIRSGAAGEQFYMPVGWLTDCLYQSGQSYIVMNITGTGFKWAGGALTGHSSGWGQATHSAGGSSHYSEAVFSGYCSDLWYNTDGVADVGQGEIYIELDV